MFSVETARQNDELSHKLDGYMIRMKDIRTGGAHLEAVNFNKAAAAMEHELKSLGRLYEQEIGKLRARIGKTTTSVFQQQSRQLELTNASDALKQRVNDQVLENSKLSDSVAELENSTSQKEQKISTLQHDINEETQNMEKQSAGGFSQLHKALRDNEELKQKLRDESVLGEEAEAKVKALERQAEFDSQAAEQELKDLQTHLCAASTAILNLEGQVRHVTRPEKDEQIAEMIAAVKDTFDRELFRYKQEAENVFTRNVTMLEAQMETERRLFNSATTENRRLTGCIEGLNSNIRNLQGELMHLDHNKCATEEAFTLQQERASRHVQALTSKLNEIQENVFSQTKELNEAKCQNLPLKAEVESLRVLIDEEKERMCLRMKRQPADYIRSLPVPAATIDDKDAYLPDETTALTSSGRLTASLSNGYPAVPLSTIPGMPSEETGYESRMSTRYTRAQSAPPNLNKTAQAQRHMLSKDLGRGRSYFDELFKQKPNYQHLCSADRTGRHVSFPESLTPKSSLGALTIHEVSADGRYIMLHNNSATTDKEFGGYFIQQNVCGEPVKFFAFPGRMTFRAGSFVTVFAGTCSSDLHQPPLQFVMNSREKWRGRSECTTVLCNVAGKAVAWVNAPHRHSTSVLNDDTPSPASSTIQPASKMPTTQCKTSTNQESANDVSSNCDGFLQRKDSGQLVTQKGQRESNFVSRRPFSAISSFKSSSGMRPAHSASGIRMGSAPMRRYTPTPLSEN